MQTSRERLLDIDRATGLAIGMVVLGHLAPGSIQPGAEWYYALKTVLYTFHMPFFMYLSGIITYYTYRPVEGIQGYKAYVYKKFIRFIPAYLLFSVIIFLGKVLASNFLDIDNNQIESIFDYFEILYLPQQSFNISLWYIYVLFEICVFFSLFLIFFKKVEYLLIPAIFVHFVNIPNVMALSLFCEYLLYFALGCICIKHYPLYIRYLDKTGWIFLIAWVGIVIYSFQYVYAYQYPTAPLPKTWMGLLSIPALHYFVRLPGCEKVRWLSYLGTLSFPIYLMNTMAIGTIKGVLFKLMSWDYHQFYMMAPILFTCGLLIPVFIKKYLLRYVPALNKIIY